MRASEDETTTRITIDLPKPGNEESDRGFVYLTEFAMQERSHADRAVVRVDGEDMEVEAAERYALALLWLVRNHYHGDGLACEVESDV